MPAKRPTTPIMWQWRPRMTRRRRPRLEEPKRHCRCPWMTPTVRSLRRPTTPPPRHRPRRWRRRWPEPLRTWWLFVASGLRFWRPPATESHRPAPALRPQGRPSLGPSRRVRRPRASTTSSIGAGHWSRRRSGWPSALSRRPTTPGVSRPPSAPPGCGPTWSPSRPPVTAPSRPSPHWPPAPTRADWPTWPNRPETPVPTAQRRPPAARLAVMVPR